MSNTLHCDCDIDDGTVSEHNLNCLVGAIHAVARALRSLDNTQAIEQICPTQEGYTPPRSPY